MIIIVIMTIVVIMVLLLLLLLIIIITTTNTNSSFITSAQLKAFVIFTKKKTWPLQQLVQHVLEWHQPEPGSKLEAMKKTLVGLARVITFLVGDPYKPSFATVTGRGDNPRYATV